MSKFEDDFRAVMLAGLQKGWITPPDPKNVNVSFAIKYKPKRTPAEELKYQQAQLREANQELKATREGTLKWRNKKNAGGFDTASSGEGQGDSQPSHPAGIVVRPEILLCPTVPQALWGVAPRTIRGDGWWDRIRKGVYRQSKDHCMACGVHKLKAKFKHYVEAHEYYNIDYVHGVVTLREIVALCHPCHNYIHHERLQAMLDAKLVTQSYFDAIHAHGEAVLRAAGYTKLRPDPPPDNCAPWDDWCMVLDDGDRHYSKFLNKEHCQRHYEIENAKRKGI